ncbi:MAG: hypothetical protein ABI836_09385 [Gemmatimonadota bacterium]
MTHTYLTSVPAPEVISRAKAFFADRVPLSAAYPEKEGPGYLVLRGQGGEEVALSVSVSPEGTRIRASTLLFDQAVSRFLSTLPVPEGAGV